MLVRCRIWGQRLVLSIILAWQVAAVGAKPRVDSSALYGDRFSLLPYESNYFLYTHSARVNHYLLKPVRSYAEGLSRSEVKFQLSFMFPLCYDIIGNHSVLSFSYTQLSAWQALSKSISSPFRETNYEPQLFMLWYTEIPLLGWSLNGLEVGLNHQSNGRSDPISRSWNRLYARFLAYKGNWFLDLKPWVRIDKPNLDDNPDINRYLGYYRLQVGYQFSNRSSLSLRGAYHWHSGYGSAQLDWRYPLVRNIYLYLQFFDGYGETLIDYNFRQSRIGIGIILNASR